LTHAPIQPDQGRAPGSAPRGRGWAFNSSYSGIRTRVSGTDVKFSSQGRLLRSRSHKGPNTRET
jgi:hypothetical protein